MKTVALLVAIGLLGACAEEESALDLARAKAAEDVAVSFVKACLASDPAGALAQCTLPFRMLSRDWEDAEALKKNLPLHMGEIARSGGIADRAEVYAGRRLQSGQWPRGEELSAEDAARRLAQIGIGPEGFLVLLTGKRGPAVSVRITPDQDGQLRVSGWLGTP
jgi:hypothetical protein